MQIAGSNREVPGSGRSNVPDSAAELERQQMHQRRILLLRTMRLWWYPILLIFLAGLVAAILGQFAMGYPLYIFGVLCLLPFLFWLSGAWSSVCFSLPSSQRLCLP